MLSIYKQHVRRKEDRTEQSRAKILNILQANNLQHTKYLVMLFWLCNDSRRTINTAFCDVLLFIFKYKTFRKPKHFEYNHFFRMKLSKLRSGLCLFVLSRTMSARTATQVVGREQPNLLTALIYTYTYSIKR